MLFTSVEYITTLKAPNSINQSIYLKKEEKLF